MTNSLLIVVVILSAIIIVFQLLSWIRQGSLLKQQVDLSPLHTRFDEFSRSLQLSEGGVRDEFSRLRQEQGGQMDQFRRGLETRFDNFSAETSQKVELLRSSLADSGTRLQTQVSQELELLRNGLTRASQQSRDETAQSLKGVGESMAKSMTDLVTSQKAELEEIRATVENRLTALSADNEKRLDQMRQTVDEKLQGTLDARLSESFKLVSERLEQVHKGLGEMQTLASGVGDLKRVLMNVKTRGTFGEVQVGTLLEQILTPDQYDKNVSTTGTQERVEFAIKLPGREAGKTCWLPVDAKFPMEDYQRLVEASERGDAEAVEAASRSLETTLKQCARTISQKYLLPPETTDFGILFLATEGLYAEALRRPGLAETLQREFRVVVTGPNTFAAILNSLQMGFRTLAIQQRTSEVWETLGAVRTQFSKYADVLAKVKKQLQMASNTVEDAERRTRVLQRQLRDVEAGTSPSAELEEPLLPLDEPQLSFTTEVEQSEESRP
jgi:DNA recombination protein RmuC